MDSIPHYPSLAIQEVSELHPTMDQQSIINPTEDFMTIANGKYQREYSETIWAIWIRFLSVPLYYCPKPSSGNWFH